MALLAERLSAQKVRQQQEAQAATDASSAAPMQAVTTTSSQSVLNAPAPVNTDPLQVDRQAGIERLQRRRQGYVGGLAGRLIDNFGAIA